MKNQKQSLGFTMIELLVVIVIIGILAGALVPAVGRFINAGGSAESRNALRRLGAAVSAYRADHNNAYPSAGGVCTVFNWRQGSGDNLKKEKRYGRAAGWVYFEHSCPRANDASKVGDGNSDSQGCGEDGGETGNFINEVGICTCYQYSTDGGGISAQPASWFEKQADGPAKMTLLNGALYPYVDENLSAYVNKAFAERAAELHKMRPREVLRAYAMNVLAGADRDIYDLGSETQYGKTSGAESGIRYGARSLRPCEKNTTLAAEDALPSKTVLFVELDLDAADITSANSLNGDQVWDWDKGDESMGFNHENNGVMEAHVCFADGHVEAIQDPSSDPMSPDTTRREQLSKWYGSGGLNAGGRLE